MKFLGLSRPGLLLCLCLVILPAFGFASAPHAAGARIRLDVERFAAKTDAAPARKVLEVFAAQPHLLAGASFVLVAPEHPMLRDLTAPLLWDKVRNYAQAARKRSFLARTDPQRPVSALPLGSYVVNPLSGWRVPVWVSDYVSGEYPLQAWLGVPAHNPWQFAFARANQIDVVPVIRLKTDSANPAGPSLRQAYSGAGTLIDSGELSGLEITGTAGAGNPAFAAALKWLKSGGKGDEAHGVDYQLWAGDRRSADLEQQKLLATKEPPPGPPAAANTAVAPPAQAPQAESGGTRGIASASSIEAGPKRDPGTPVQVAPGPRESERGLLGTLRSWLGLVPAPAVSPGLNVMVDHSWLSSKPRMGKRDERDLHPLLGGCWFPLCCLAEVQWDQPGEAASAL